MKIPLTCVSNFIFHLNAKFYTTVSHWSVTYDLPTYRLTDSKVSRMLLVRDGSCLKCIISGLNDQRERRPCWFIAVWVWVMSRVAVEAQMSAVCWKLLVQKNWDRFDTLHKTWHTLWFSGRQKIWSKRATACVHCDSKCWYLLCLSWRRRQWNVRSIPVHSN